MNVSTQTLSFSRSEIKQLNQQNTERFDFLSYQLRKCDISSQINRKFWSAPFSPFTPQKKTTVNSLNIINHKFLMQNRAFHKLFTLLFLFSLLLPAQTLQMWTSTNGHSFQGVLVRMEEQAVVLKGTDGKEITVPLRALDQTSRSLAASEAILALENGPVFQHQNRQLRFFLYSGTKWLELEFLNAGSSIPKQNYQLFFSMSESIGVRKNKQIDIDEIVEPVTMENGEASMRIRMQNGVVVKFTVELNDNKELKFRYDTEEVTENHTKISLRVSMNFPALLDYDISSKSYKGPIAPKGVLFENFPELLENYNIRLDKNDNDTIMIPYHDKRSKGFRGQRITIFRDDNPPLILSAPKESADGSLNTSFYGGKSPAEGYVIHFAPAKGTNQAGIFTISLK